MNQVTLASETMEAANRLRDLTAACQGDIELSLDIKEALLRTIELIETRINERHLEQKGLI